MNNRHVEMTAGVWIGSLVWLTSLGAAIVTGCSDDSSVYPTGYDAGAPGYPPPTGGAPPSGPGASGPPPSGPTSDAGVASYGDAGTATSTVAMKQTVLVSDDGSAGTRDTNLLNAWGLAINPGAPGGPFFWTSDNHSGLSTVYDASGNIIPLVVNLTPAADGSASAAPTGIVFNTTGAFKGDAFIFDGEDGKITGWQSGAVGVLRSDQSAAGAIYKGLAIVGKTLWAANFHAGTIDIFDDGYAKTATAASDSGMPQGYAPFNVASINGKVYVAYAQQDDDAEDDKPGAGHGYVDVFTEAGQLDKRLISGGVLDSPWALALAPAGFGAFAGALLVGNFGDGTIHAFDLASGAALGAVVDASGNPLVIPGLWDLKFGPKTASSDLSSVLFYTAGPGDEEHGVFGKLELVH